MFFEQKNCRFVFLLFFFTFLEVGCSDQSNAMHFVTVADSEHFPWLEGLIASILKYNYTKISKIAVFDLGLRQSEVDRLKQIKFVEVYQIEDVNSEMRVKFIVRTNGRLARGWYSWKPIVFYQALKMFPSFLYLDSGVEVCAPLDAIFDEIEREGYYLFDGMHLIYPVVTDQVKQLFELNREENRWILEENCISAGIQGISRCLLDSYVAPMYQLASNIKNFEDNGSSAWGYGFARHDQSLFSILARKLQLKTHPFYCCPTKIRVGDHKIYFGGLRYFKLRKHIEKNGARLEHAKIYNLLG